MINSIAGIEGSGFLPQADPLFDVLRRFGCAFGRRQHFVNRDRGSLIFFDIEEIKVLRGLWFKCQFLFLGEKPPVEDFR